MYVYDFYEINYGNATIYVCTRMYVMFTHLPTQILQREMYVCMYVCMRVCMGYCTFMILPNPTSRRDIMFSANVMATMYIYCPLSHR